MCSWRCFCLDEKNKEINTSFDENESESTIFLKSEEKEVKIKKKLSPIKTIVLLVIIGLALVLGSLLIIFLNHNSVSDTSSVASSNTITILNNNTINISKVRIKNQYGTLVFNATKVNNDGETVDSFLLEGYDKELIADSYNTSIVDKAALLDALREMNGKGNYGFDNPLSTIEVFGRNGLADYTITIGNLSPDKSGYYVKTSLDNKIYLIAVSVAELFLYPAEKFSNNMLIVPPNEETVSANYLADDGSLAYVDTIKMSGAKYSKDIVINHTDNKLAAYRITAPISRYADADKIASFTKIMTNGVVAEDCYKLLPSSADYKKYGLNNPDSVIEIKYDTTTIKIVAKKQGDGYYAITIDERKAIYKINNEALEILSYNLSDLFNQFVFLESIEDFSNITFKSDKEYSFDIAYNEEKNTTAPSFNGKKINDSIFRTYYDYFLYLKPELVDNYKPGASSYTAIFTFRDTKKGKITVEFINQNDRQYTVKINGNNEGVITYTYFDSIKNYLSNVINNKDIPEIL